MAKKSMVMGPLVVNWLIRISKDTDFYINVIL